ncbi:MAG TPA: XRE family transcriptional regulator [Bacillota bacterium]|jgi:transcriptional regulator with XRE-family HTH domain|nr:XRE family transcriptional regulator [Bacillota bacterium]NLD13178.1 helix-turn-helix domain-containing protein [Bacillota bacterium]HAV21163.1 XRE family transcriptional regulator [Bacillota bacterium]HOB89672.1 XRE family transcriptional regulator [Bacillota bacterium]HOJ58460.1 XRE family transcriptional regulator [Bacillota bacterium]
MDFGARLKKARTNSGISARELADKVGVSASFIYQLERGEAAPSYSTLKRIASVLGIAVSVLTDDEFPDEWVISRKAGRRSLVAAHELHGVEAQLLAFLGSRNRRMQGVVVTVGPGCRYSKDEFLFNHDRDDFVYVLEGALEIDSGEKTYHLEQGDAAYFSLTDMDAIRNPGEARTQVLWIVSPSGA